MLRAPYTRYHRLYTYHLMPSKLPPVEDPDLIGIWHEDETVILFFHTDKHRFIKDFCLKHNASLVYQADLDYQDWESGCELTPFNVGNLTVAPCWLKEHADIRIDPSVIFGSGFHPTTRICLARLHDYLAAQSISSSGTIHDLGTGTGLLAIAAAKLSNSKILAIDHNPLACQVAENNCQINEIQDRVTVKMTDLFNSLPDGQPDLVIANLHKELLLHLFNHPEFWHGKYYILSGFFRGAEEELLAAIPTDKVQFRHRETFDRWCLWELMKT